MSEALSHSTDSASPKVDPETLVLRAKPTRVVRFRRGAIIGIAVLTSTTIAAASWLALKPVSFQPIASSDVGAKTGTNPPPDALSGAPKSYGDVPQLGAPLPGDLGGPILEHQGSIGALPPQPGADQAAQAAQAKRERLIAERKAARESGMMVSLGASNNAGDAPSSSTSAPPAPIGEDAGERIALDPEPNPGNQQDKADFLAAKHERDINPHRLVQPASPYILSAGTLISASLITGLNSDLPGLVIAQVTENAFDTATGRILLIPQGTRLIGGYDNVVAFGQKRALVVWQRMILPDGSSIQIDNMPATDTAGYAGLADKVDLHTWQLLKGVVLSTLLGVGTELSFGDESDLVRAIRESTQQGALRAGDQIVLKNLNVQPTLRVRPGWPLRLIVHKDLVLRPWPATRR